MASLEILDTGYLNISDTGTQESTANMANGGSAISLKSVEINWSRGIRLDDSPAIGSTNDDNINKTSTVNPTVTVRGVFNRTNTTDMGTTLAALDNCIKTRGVKLLYYSSTSDDWNEITEYLGATDSVHLGGTIPHLHVQCTAFSVIHGASAQTLKFTITMEVTA